MLHTFELNQMHSSILKYNTHCKMTHGCSNMFLRHIWVTPSRILLLMINPSFPQSPHISATSMGMHKVTSPCACVNGKGQGFILESLPMVSSIKPYLYHGLEMCVMSVTMVTLLHSSTFLEYFQHGKHEPFPCMYIKDLMSIQSSFCIKRTFAT